MVWEYDKNGQGEGGIYNVPFVVDVYGKKGSRAKKSSSGESTKLSVSEKRKRDDRSGSKLSGSLSYKVSSFLAEAIDYAYQAATNDFDHDTYVTNKGNRIPIPANPKRRSLVAREAVRTSKNIQLKGLGINTVVLTFGYFELFEKYQSNEKIDVVDVLPIGIGTAGFLADFAIFAGYKTPFLVSVSGTSTYFSLVFTTVGIWYITYYQPISEFEKFNSPITNNKDEARWNQYLQSHGVWNDSQIFTNY